MYISCACQMHTDRLGYVNFASISQRHITVLLVHIFYEMIIIWVLLKLWHTFDFSAPMVHMALYPYNYFICEFRNFLCSVGCYCNNRNTPFIFMM